MSKMDIEPKSIEVNIKNQPNVEFSIHDTELLLRVLLETQYSGRDVAQATDTIAKVREVHDRLLKKRELIK
tara:strand:- start:1237 stop:1449 length:213 start_codon:yes stop_codon:yes gene_type:complete